MDYTINKETLAINDTIFDGCMEQPMDLDFSLPDYCHDIQSILKCQIYPEISGRNISGDRLDVEGSAKVCLIYLDPGKKSVRHCDYASPFTASFDLKTAPQDAMIFTKAEAEYVNCRASSQRKLNIHGAFSVGAKVKSKTGQEIANDLTGEGIEQKKIGIKSSHVRSMTQQQFSISEVIEINNGHRAIESIVRTSINTVIEDYKILDNKLIINAQATLKLLYLSSIETGEIDSLEVPIPISQIVDLEGATDDCVCDINIETLNHDIQVRSTSSGEENLLSVDFKVVISSVAYEEKEVELLSDSYSTKYEIETKYSTVKVPRLIKCINQSCTNKSMIDLADNNFSRVIDVWNEMISVNPVVEEDKIIFKVKLNACILAVNADETPFYSERMIDFEYEYALDNNHGDVLCESNVYLSSMSYRTVGTNNIEIRADVRISAAVYKINKVKSITEVFCDESRPKSKETQAALTVYYADNGENLWDIAKKYSTSMHEIKSENNLESDILNDGGMILIPMK